MTYPSGRVINFGHDNKGRLTSVGSYLTSVTYDGIGQLTGTALGNGVAESYGYDANRMQLTSQTATKSGGPANGLMNLTYGYQASAGQMGAGSTAGNAGQLMTISGTMAATPCKGCPDTPTAENTSYTYDVARRLATSNQTSNGSSAQRRFAYDRWGNRTGMWNAVSGGTQIQSVVLQQSGGAPTNRLTSVTTSGVTANYSYDAAGNVTNDGVHTYTYDAENRIASVDSGTTATYAYDTSNQRYKKVTSGATTHYVWQASQVIAEHNGSTGASIADYVNSGSRILARVSGLLTQYFLNDRLSVRLTLDSSGSVLGRQSHLPFGEDFGESGNQEKHHFTSYDRDSESGSDYALNRQYSQDTGRFLRVDSYNDLSDPQSLNRYAYVKNDPIGATDPLGLWPSGIILLAGGGIAVWTCWGEGNCGWDYRLMPISENEPKYQPRPECPERYRKFFENIGLYQYMAIQLRTEVVFLVALSAYESGWRNSHNDALHNLFGVTNAGGNNLRYKSFQAAADDWIRRFGQYVSGAETMGQFNQGLRNVPPHGYNAVNSDYYNTLKSMVETVKRFAERCGIDLTTPMGPPG